MSVLVYAESPNGKFKKSTFEVITYGRKVADMIGTQCIALVLGEASDARALGIYGAHKVVHCSSSVLNEFDSQVFTNAIAQACNQLDSKIVILGHTARGKAAIGRLAVKLNKKSIMYVHSRFMHLFNQRSI